MGPPPPGPPRRRDPEGRRRRSRACLARSRPAPAGRAAHPLQPRPRPGPARPGRHRSAGAARALPRRSDAIPIPPSSGRCLKLRQAASADDTHLVHVVRMALRDQFHTDAGWAALDAEPWSDRDLRDVADVAPGVPSAAAARFLLTQLRRDDELRSQPPGALRPPRRPLRGRGDRTRADRVHRRPAAVQACPARRRS